MGTLINAGGILLGGILGHFFGKLMNERIQSSLTMACGVSVLFIGISGTMEGMLDISSGSVSSSNSMLIVISLCLGALTGEIIDIEAKLEKFGEWLKVKSGNSGDNQFVNGFVTASLTVCIGAMAIVGSIQDGIYHDSSILVIKAILDLIIVMVMTCSLGKGCIFSAIPVLILQGSVTILASLVAPIMTEKALFNLSLVGSILIFCVGLNLVWGKKVRVANFLPALVFAVIAAFINF